MAHNKERRVEMIKLIHKERARQECLHPLETYDDTFFLAVLTEEVGEVAKAILEGSNLEEELIQVASVCLRWLENRK